VLTVRMARFPWQYPVPFQSPTSFEACTGDERLIPCASRCRIRVTEATRILALRYVLRTTLHSSARVFYMRKLNTRYEA